MHKQVLVIRKDLNMRKGKIAAQAAHASMKAILDQSYIQVNETNLNTLVIPLTTNIEPWISGLFTKICVSVNSEEELINIYNQAKSANICCSLIQDAGLTEFNGQPTLTAVAVGPDVSELIDPITGHLSLL